MKKILVTGAAGFIGFHLIEALIRKGETVIGLDCINDYYSIDLKLGRLSHSGISKDTIEYNKLAPSSKNSNYQFIKLKLEDDENLDKLFAEQAFTHVINLAAQAGVRYSIENPRAYVSSNIVGFVNILEACRHHKIEHLSYASSSSVYGLNESMPFSLDNNVDPPL